VNPLNADLVRLKQILAVVQKEDHHLLAVRGRLAPSVQPLDLAWLERTTDDSIGIDRLESFSSKFSRMQDTVIDKLLPQLLVATGEIPMAAIDNLNRAERLGFIESSETWIEMRRLRNRLVHEYIDELEDMLPAVRMAYAFTDELHNTYQKIAAYAQALMKQGG
jgi:hypothetical protein